jgi:NifB/MoaA-like Fe-S oxidoreductase
MPQFENGIGMVREFVTMFNRRRSRLKSIKSKLRVMMITGHSAYRFLKTEILPYIDDYLSLNLSFHPVVNRFWGETVTVSGLLTGQDILREARKKADDFDLLVLPPNCLNSDDLFLDNLTLTQFKQTLGKPVVVGRYNIAETVREVFS